MIRLAAVDGQVKADGRLKEMHAELGRLIDSGEVTGFIVLHDGPHTRDVLAAGDLDVDGLSGYSLRVFAALAGMAE